jgi:hypothetical protein
MEGVEAVRSFGADDYQSIYTLDVTTARNSANGCLCLVLTLTLTHVEGAIRDGCFDRPALASSGCISYYRSGLVGSTPTFEYVNECFRAKHVLFVPHPSS